MRFASYSSGSGPVRAGVVSEAGIHPLSPNEGVLDLVRAGPPALRPGDIVELTVEGIGTVRNRVVPGLALAPVRAARTRSVPRSRKRG
jgi:hypothetical protein